MLKTKDIMTHSVMVISGSATSTDIKLTTEKNPRALMVALRHEHDLFGIVSKTKVVDEVADQPLDHKTKNVLHLAFFEEWQNSAVYPSLTDPSPTHVHVCR